VIDHFDIAEFAASSAAAAQAQFESDYPNILVRDFSPAVYVFAVQSYVKIGWSENIAQREYQLAGGYGKLRLRPADVPKKNDGEIIAAWPGDRLSERFAHRALAEHQVIGEWFHHNDAVRAYIQVQVDAARDGRPTA
jgi:hypothetical protein